LVEEEEDAVAPETSLTVQRRCRQHKGLARSGRVDQVCGAQRRRRSAECVVL